MRLVLGEIARVQKALQIDPRLSFSGGGLLGDVAQWADVSWCATIRPISLIQPSSIWQSIWWQIVVWVGFSHSDNTSSVVSVVLVLPGSIPMLLANRRVEEAHSLGIIQSVALIHYTLRSNECLYYIIILLPNHCFFEKIILQVRVRLCIIYVKNPVRTRWTVRNHGADERTVPLRVASQLCKDYLPPSTSTTYATRQQRRKMQPGWWSSRVFLGSTSKVTPYGCFQK